MKPSDSPSNLAPLGPHSRALARGVIGDAIDGRSREGKFLRRIEVELLEQIGGDPTFTQKLAVRRVARLALQAELFDQKMASGNWTAHDSRTAAGINNGLMRALKDLGLKGRAEKAPSITLADIAARHAKGVSA